MTYHAARTTGASGAPLFLTFHGTGGNEQQFHGFAQELMPDAHIVSPRGDVSEMGALRYFRRTGEGVYDMADLEHRTAAMADFIRIEKDRTKSKRVIALGYSNGANILANVAFHHSDLFTDLLLLHPLIPFDPSPVHLKTRVLITAGQRDPISPAPLTQRLIDWFATQGADVTPVWHPGGHEIAQSEVSAVHRFLG